MSDDRAIQEPTLLDVFHSVFSGYRVRRGLLIALALYLGYKGAAALTKPEASWAEPVVVWGLGLIVLIAALVIRAPPAPQAGSAVALPEIRLAAPRVGGQPLAVWRSARLLLAVGVAFAAQWQMFKNPAAYPFGLTLWAAALALWYPTLQHKLEAIDAAAPTDERPVNWWGVATGALLSWVAFLSAADNLYTPFVVVPWLLSLVVFPASLYSWRLRAEWSRFRAWLGGFKFEPFRVNVSWTAIAVIAILTLGAGLRFYQLDDVPREMTSDHVEKLLDVNDVLRGHYAIFFVRNTGREPLQFYYTAALMRLFDLPLAHLTLKIGTALAGSAALLFVFLLGRELGGTEVGLWTMLLSAVARWPIALSRAGLRYPFAPLFAALTFYFLARGLKSGRRADFVWAGLFAGAGLYGYSSFRVVPLAILVIVGLWLLQPGQTSRTGRRLAANLGALAGVALVTLMPLFRYMLDAPQMFWYRILSRVSAVEQPLPPDVPGVLWENLYRALLMFNYTRDIVWTVNISNWPTLSPMLAALFGLGCIYLLVQALRRDGRAMFVVATWFLLLLPSGLSLTFAGENPSVARAGIAFPFVFLIAGWGAALVRREALKHWPGWGGRALAISVFVIVGYIARNDFHDYFVTFRDQYAMSATNPSEVSAVIRAFNAGGVPPDNIWLKGYPHWLDARAVALEAFGHFDWQNAVLDPEELIQAGDDARPKLFTVHVWDQPAIAKLRELYPNGILAYHTSPTPGKDFLTYFVPGVEDFDENSLPTP